MSKLVAEPCATGEPDLGKTCLLIIPRHFYSFEKHIRQELQRRGFEVTVANDEYPEGTWGKILGKLQMPSIFARTRKVFERRFLAGRRYDLALIFKGRGMSPQLIALLREACDEVVGYNWDSFKLNRSPLRWMAGVTRYFTFDYRDAERAKLPLVELFSASPTLSGEKKIEYEVCTIVRNHSGRLRYIDRVLRVLNPATFYVSIFELNVFTFLYNLVRNPRLYFKYRRFISFKPLNYSEYSRVMAVSAFTIDYAHDTQTGVTMRCFEAVNSRTKIITNNEYISRSQTFHEVDYVVFPDNAESEQFTEAFQFALRQPFASRPRTIQHFIAELVEPIRASTSKPFQTGS